MAFATENSQMKKITKQEIMESLFTGELSTFSHYENGYLLVSVCRVCLNSSQMVNMYVRSGTTNLI